MSETVDWRKVVKHLKATCTIIAKNGGDRHQTIDILHGIAAAIEAGLPREMPKLTTEQYTALAHGRVVFLPVEPTPMTEQPAKEST